LNPSTQSRERLTTLLLAFGLFLLNVYVCRDLFHIEYLRHMGSIEGAYIGISRYAMTHWRDLSWFPLWYDGIPYQNTYPPILHWTVALFANLFGVSPARSYHEVTAFAYCLGPVTVFALALRLSKSKWAAFTAGLIYSSVSMSAWLIPAIANDMGSWLHPRRLQALVGYGEGPHVFAMTLLPLALLLLDLARERGGAALVLLAALGMAATVLTNWLAAFALALMVVSYVIAFSGNGGWKWRDLGNIAVIVAAAYCLAMPWAPPSTIAVIQFNAGTIGGDFTKAYREFLPRWGILTLIALWLIKLGVRKLEAHFQFAIFFTTLTASITLPAAWWDYAIVPQPIRYHLEMEMAVAMLIASAALALLRNRPRSLVAVMIGILILMLVQPIRRDRRYARDALLRPIDITTTTEWQVAQWMNQHWTGERILAEGSNSFWLTAFSDVPELGGGFDQGITNYMIRVGIYGVDTGDQAGEHDAEYSILWLKALGVQAVDVDGPNSAEFYKPIRNPGKFEGVLEPLGRAGGDTIYRVGASHAPLARIVPRDALVKRTPVNAIDVDPLRPYVAALDNPELPLAHCGWINAHDAKITADLQPDQVISMQVAWHKGWRATANGREIPVLHDAIGLMYLEPAVAGPATVEMIYDGGTEMGVAHWASAITAILLLIACAWQLWARAILKKS
jgi:hypothetical protein